MTSLDLLSLSVSAAPATTGDAPGAPARSASKDAFAALLGAQAPSRARKGAVPAEETAQSYSLSAPLAPGLLLPPAAPFVVALQTGAPSVAAQAVGAVPPAPVAAAAATSPGAPAAPQPQAATQAPPTPSGGFADGAQPVPQTPLAPQAQPEASVPGMPTPPETSAQAQASGAAPMLATTPTPSPPRARGPAPRATEVAPTTRAARYEETADADLAALNPAAPSGPATSQPPQPIAAVGAEKSKPAAPDNAPIVEASATPDPLAGAEGSSSAAATNAETAAVEHFEPPPLGAHRATPDPVALAQAVVHKAEGRGGAFEIRLDPEELGRVKISVEVGEDQSAIVSVAADRPETLSDLMRASRELERALQDAGLALAENGLSFDLSQARDERRDGANARGEGTTTESADAGPDAEPVRARPFGYAAWSPSRIDVTI